MLFRPTVLTRSPPAKDCTLVHLFPSQTVFPVRTAVQHTEQDRRRLEKDVKAAGPWATHHTRPVCTALGRLRWSPQAETPRAAPKPDQNVSGFGGLDASACR